MIADLHAPEEIDRKINHQGLVKSKIEEISVLAKAIVEAMSALDGWVGDAANEPEDVAQLLMVSSQAGDSEHPPMNQGRNSSPGLELCTYQDLQASVGCSQSFGPESRHSHTPGETTRPKQSKQRQLWDRHEGKTKVVD